MYGKSSSKSYKKPAVLKVRVKVHRNGKPFKKNVNALKNSLEDMLALEVSGEDHGEDIGSKNAFITGYEVGVVEHPEACRKLENILKKDGVGEFNVGKKIFVEVYNEPRR